MTAYPVELIKESAMLVLMGAAKVYSAHNVPVPDACGAVFDLLIANKAFIEQLSAEQIVFQDYVASSSSKNPSSGDMMIYMGKNPRQISTNRAYQFALAEYLMNVGSVEMWKNHLVTSFLTSGLLALNVSGCVQAPKVETWDNFQIEKTDFYEVVDSDVNMQNEDGASRILFYNSLTKKYTIITESNDVYESDDFKHFSKNETVSSLFKTCGFNCWSSVYDLGGVMLFISTNGVYRTTDFRTFTNCLSFTPAADSIYNVYLYYWRAKKMFIAVNSYRYHPGYYSPDGINSIGDCAVYTSIDNGTSWIRQSDYQGSPKAFINDDWVLFESFTPGTTSQGPYGDYKFAVTQDFQSYRYIDRTIEGHLVQPFSVIDNRFFTNTNGKVYELNKDCTEYILTNLPSVPNTSALVENGWYMTENGSLYRYNKESEEKTLIFTPPVSGSYRVKVLGNTVLLAATFNNHIYYSTDNCNSFTHVDLTEYINENSCLYYNSMYIKNLNSIILFYSRYAINTFGNKYHANPHREGIILLSPREAGSGIIAESKGTSQNWVRFSNGLLAQWGIVYKGSTLNHGALWSPIITLPLAYPDNNYHVMLSAGDQDGGGNELRERTDLRTSSTIQVNWYNRNSGYNTSNPSVFWLTLGWG